MSFAPDIQFKVDDAEVQALLNELSSKTGKSVGSIIKDRAMTYARYLAENTQPVAGLVGGRLGGRITEQSAPDGGSKLALKLGESAVMRDIKRVYTSPQAVFASIRKHLTGKGGLQVAKAFMAAIENGKYTEAKDILKRNNIPGALYLDVMAWDNGSRHKQKRNNRGRINKGTKPVIVSDKEALKKYKDKKKKLVGYSKAGWINAAKPINTRGIGQVSQWIKKHNAPGQGSDRTNDGNNPRIVLTNGVPWASQVISPSQFARTVMAFEGSLAKEVENILTYLADKKSKSDNRR